MANAISSALEEKLRQFGFVPVTYEGQDGVFLAKRLKATAMPYFSQHVVDNDIVSETDMVVVEVCPGDTVQLTVEKSDYFEEPVPVDSEEGRSLLKDAGATLD